MTLLRVLKIGYGEDTKNSEGALTLVIASLYHLIQEIEQRKQKK